MILGEEFRTHANFSADLCVSVTPFRKFLSIFLSELSRSFITAFMLNFLFGFYRKMFIGGLSWQTTVGKSLILSSVCFILEL